MTPAEREGNMRADELATKGTQLHEENAASIKKQQKDGDDTLYTKIHFEETRTTGRQESH